MYQIPPRRSKKIFRPRPRIVPEQSWYAVFSPALEPPENNLGAQFVILNHVISFGLGICK